MPTPAIQPRTDYLALVARTRRGVSVADAVEVMQTWAIPVAKFAQVLGVSPRKWSRVRTEAPEAVLSPVESDRLVRAWRIFEHAKAVFDDDKGVAAWFAAPNPALSGEAPLSMMDTDAGVHEVDNILARLEFGVYG